MTPAPVPPPIRAGTPSCLPMRRRKSLSGASFGVQGTDLAPLHRPLPFMCLGLPVRVPLTACHPGRSGSVPHKGQGARPCTPARSARPLAQADFLCLKQPRGPVIRVTGPVDFCPQRGLSFLFPLFV